MKGWVSVAGHAHFGMYTEKCLCQCGQLLLKQFDSTKEAQDFANTLKAKISHDDIVRKRYKELEIVFET